MRTEVKALLERYCREFSDFAGLTLTDVNERGYGRNTPIHVAAQAGQKEDIELLLGAGADVNALGEMGLMDGLTALDWSRKLDATELEQLLK